jgi:hypothetical protein
VSAKWYLKNGELWKEENYTVKAGGELFLDRSSEREYTQLEIGTADSPWYHSATVEKWYEDGEYRTAREEYDSLHGSDSPIKCIYYDGSRHSECFYEGGVISSEVRFFEYSKDTIYYKNGNQIN